MRKTSRLGTLAIVLFMTSLLLVAAWAILTFAKQQADISPAFSAQAWPGGGGEQLIYGVLDSLTPIPIKVSGQSNDRYGAIDVYIQDQHTQVLLSPFLVESGITATMAITASPGDWTISITPTGGVVASHTIAFGKAGFWWDGHVYTTSGATLILDQSINVTYEVGTIIKVFTSNLALDGSVTRIVSKVYPVPTVDLDIMEMHLNMVCSTEPDDSKFCNLAALPRGLSFRFWNGETGLYENLRNAKTNGMLSLFCDDVTYTDKAGGGAYAVRAVCQYRQDAGVTIRLRGATTGNHTPLGRDELHLIIQDDLTGINAVNIVLIGHVVRH